MGSWCVACPSRWSHDSLDWCADRKERKDGKEAKGDAKESKDGKESKEAKDAIEVLDWHIRVSPGQRRCPERFQGVLT